MTLNDVMAVSSRSLIIHEQRKLAVNDSVALLRMLNFIVYFQNEIVSVMSELISLIRQCH